MGGTVGVAAGASTFGGGAVKALQRYLATMYYKMKFIQVALC